MPQQKTTYSCKQ